MREDGGKGSSSECREVWSRQPAGHVAAGVTSMAGLETLGERGGDGERYLRMGAAGQRDMV